MSGPVRFFINLFCFAVLVAQADAAVISVTDSLGSSNIVVSEGTFSTEVYLRIAQGAGDPVNSSGNVEIQNASISFIIGDGGGILGGSDQPIPITAFANSNTGSGVNESIWQPQAANLVGAPSFLYPSFNAQIQSVAVNVANTNVEFGSALTAEVLGVFTVETGGLVAGQSDGLGTVGGFLLNPTHSSAATTAGFASGAGGTTSLNLAFTPGVLRITSTAIPEPGSFVLLTVGAMAVCGRYRLRRRPRSADDS